MNVLFMTIAYPKAGERNIYADLMQEFKLNNHKVYIACTNERRHNLNTAITVEDGKNVLRIRTGNLTGNINMIEKGVTTLSIESAFISAIKKYFQNIHFDLIIYSTPPITFVRAVQYFKNRDNAKTYLLLKDIFPQNAVDINLIKRDGLLYRYFRKKERKLYLISDFIGCMSQANVDYVLNENGDINASKIEVCPNSIIPYEIDIADKMEGKNKYNIPTNCTLFVYGGNLGKPQGVDFILECLTENMNKNDRFFIICGNGSEYQKLEVFFAEMEPENALLLKMLPKLEYDEILKCCDVGLIFLDHRFTIPNFPSRLLSYMEHSIPVLACTDKNTDVGEVILHGNYGWWCESKDSNEFRKLVDKICLLNKDLNFYGNNAREYLVNNYTANISYEIIMKHFT